MQRRMENGPSMKAFAFMDGPFVLSYAQSAGQPPQWKIGILCLDFFFHGLRQLLPGEILQVVVREVFHLQFVRGAAEPLRVRGGHHRVCQFPNAADRILEAAVSVNHDFQLLARGLRQFLLQPVYKALAIPREQLHFFLRRLVCPQEAILLIIAAAVHRSGHDIVQAVNTRRAACLQDALCAFPRMDVAVDYVFRISQNIAGVVGEYDLNILPEALVIFDIVHARERMDRVKSERLTEPLLVKAVRIRIDLLPVHVVLADQMVPHLVRGIRQLHIELLAGHAERPKHDRKTIPTQNREIGKTIPISSPPSFCLTSLAICWMVA